MRAVLQRVSKAEVRSEGRLLGRIGRGLVVLLGVGREDTSADADFICDRTLGMRIFADADGKMNLALTKVAGELLIVSQFTLLADTESGRRPSFIKAAQPQDARRLYEYFLSLAQRSGVKVESGEFGAMMEVDLVNDGPVTILLDSRNR
jgi:D-tyrosyl-tRNA(Tyr) deacylase